MVIKMNYVITIDDRKINAKPTSLTQAYHIIQANMSPSDFLAIVWDVDSEGHLLHEVAVYVYRCRSNRILRLRNY